MTRDGLGSARGSLKASVLGSNTPILYGTVNSSSLQAKSQPNVCSLVCSQQTYGMKSVRFSETKKLTKFKNLHVFVEHFWRSSCECIRVRWVADDIPTAHISLKSSLPKNVITANRIPVTANAANSAQVFCTEEWKNVQLQTVLQQQPTVNCETYKEQQ